MAGNGNIAVLIEFLVGRKSIVCMYVYDGINRISDLSTEINEQVGRGGIRTILVSGLLCWLARTNRQRFIRHNSDRQMKEENGQVHYFHI